MSFVQIGIEFLSVKLWKTQRDFLSLVKIIKKEEKNGTPFVISLKTRFHEVKFC